MKAFLWLLYKIGFYPLFLLTVLLLFFVPLMSLQDLFHVLGNGAPVTSVLPVLMFVGFILYLSFRVSKTQAIYVRFPILIPALQMGFTMAVATALALECVNQWADNGLFSKWVATSLAVLCIILGRLFMSYWWYKYPISSKLRRAE